MYAPWNGSNLSQKATEALERKKRNDVEGQIMAEYRAQKEAERKDRKQRNMTRADVVADKDDATPKNVREPSDDE
uniref:Uncharacterized protein n=1 Tax=Tanacetum cinerariifolium TaxID=118510 RepID=A0A6L2JZG0_TANCI|nr:hypothetical protein [Tanacetum cinerariifolium]